MPERKSTWRPGHPDTRKRLDGRLSKNRYAWIKIHMGVIQLNVITDADEATPEFPSVFVNYPQPGTRAMNWNLTNLTRGELDTWKKLMDLAYEKAAPVCSERDRVANEAMEAGDDSYARSYRQDPLFAMRGDGARRRDAVEVTPEED
jgi:hypothetical protein